MMNITYGGIAKSCISFVPRPCNSTQKLPWAKLSVTEGGGHGGGTAHIQDFGISFYQGYYWPLARRSCKYKDSLTSFIGYCFGVLVARGPNPHNFYLRYSSLPPWDAKIPLKFIALSSLPLGPKDCIVLVLTGISYPAFLVYRIPRRRGDQFAWTKQECKLVDPYDFNEQFMTFTSAIWFKGKFYVLSLQGTLAVIEDVDSRLRITTLSKSRAVPSLLSKHFREYLVESDGEILMVFLISRKLINFVDDVEVFCLKFPKLVWVKMESLGDRTFFVGANSFMWVASSKVGCRRNYIYFTQQAVDGWWGYEMGNKSILPGWSSDNSTTKSPIWDEPKLGM